VRTPSLLQCELEVHHSDGLKRVLCAFCCGRKVGLLWDFLFIKKVRNYLDVFSFFFMRLFAGCLLVSGPVHRPADYPEEKQGRQEQ